jgi:hypothetical protein
MSCLYTLNIAPFQNAINSTVLPAIGDSPIPSSYSSTATGQFNNITFVNGGLEFSGSDGNTTTAGYYLTYDLYVKSLASILQFNIQFPSSTLCLGETSYQFPLITIKTFNYNYYNSIKSNILVNSNQYAYTPQYTTQVCAVCCCGDPISSCCYDTCDCKNETIPSTYPGIETSESYSGTITTTPSPDTISLSYTISDTLPSGYNISQVYEVQLPPGYISPYSTLFIYNLNVTELAIHIEDVTITGVPAPPGGWNISAFNSDFNTIVSKYLVPYLNTFIQNNAFQFNLVQT